MSHCQVVQNGSILEVTLDRPKALNAITIEMIDEIIFQLDRLQQENHLVGMVLLGGGGKAFSAGGDVRAIYDDGHQNPHLAPSDQTAQFFLREYQMNLALHRSEKPVVSLVDGIVMGGGVGLSFHGARAVVTENALFAMPEVAIGFVPDVGGTYALSHCPGKLGLLLGVTGARLKGREILDAQLVHGFIQSEHLDVLREKLSRATSPENVLEITDAHIDRERREFPDLSVIDQACQGSMNDMAEALKNSEHPFLQKAYAGLTRGSPLACHVVHKQLTSGLGQNLIDALRLEYRLVVRMLRKKDFYEGVHAVLVDRSHQPEWLYPSISDVPESELSDILEPLDLPDWDPDKRY